MLDVGRLNREELSIQARLNNRALKAATHNPLSSSEEEEAPRMTNTNIDIMNDTPLKMSDAWRKDIAFQVQNEIISNNAITDNNAFGEPMKIKSHVTQQMIDEYRAEQQNPLLLNNKTFVYHPGRLAVELETFTPQPVKISYRNIRDVKRGQKVMAKQISDNNKEIVRLDTVERTHIDDVYNGNITSILNLSTKHAKNIQLQTEITELEEKKNEVSGITNIVDARKLADGLGIAYKKGTKLKTIQNSLISYYDTDINQKQKALKANPKSVVNFKHEYEENERQYNEAKEMLETNIKNLRDANENLEKDLKEVDQDIKDSELTSLNNTREEARIERDNKTKLKNLEDELTILNSGAMVMAQGPGESDEDYKNRLLSTGQATFDEKLLEEQAISVQLVKCKYNLKNIVSDDGKVETIAKKLNPDQRYEYNKVATGINKKYLDTFGFDNKTNSEETIAQFIKDAIENGIASTQPSTLQSQIQAGGQAYNPRSLSSFSKPELVDLINANKDANPSLEGHKTKPQMYEALLVLKLIPIKPPRGGGGVAAAAPPPPPPLAEGEPIIGASVGIAHQKLPKLIPFGNYYINPDKLYYKNILAIRQAGGQPINGYTDVKVSDNFIAIILKMLKGDKVAKHDFNLLSEKEQMIYDNLMYMSKLYKNHHNTVDKTVQKMKDRFAVLEGEIEAGNTNSMILKEIYELLFKMSKNNVISGVEAQRYWKELNKK